MAMGDGGGRKSDIISLHEMKEAQHGGRGGKGREGEGREGERKREKK